MAEQTFRINVVIDPSNAKGGAQSVKSELAKLNTAAGVTQGLLKKALTVIGVEEGVRAIIGLIDAYTKLQNRIRVVVQNNEILGVVTQRVFDIAQRSRSSFIGTAELFSRVALATRELGVSENDLLGVTESVNKAIILSGASAKEANNGLIQLSQGLASNRLGGDELRAVLEQLPVVADVIAKHLGLTRGQLRIFSREGNIDAKTVIDAFKEAGPAIERSFARTIPTIGQAIQLLKNNLVKVVGELSSSAGVSNTLASAISLLARNVETLIKLFAVLGATLAAAKLAPFVQGVFDAARATKELATVQGIAQSLIIKEAAAEEVAAAAQVQKTQATIAAIESQQALAHVDILSTEVAQAQAVANVEASAAIIRKAEVTAEAAAAQNAALISSESALDVLFAAQVQEAELLGSREALIASTSELAVAQEALNVTVERGTLTAAANAAVDSQLIALKGQLAAEQSVLTLTQGRLNTAMATTEVQAVGLSGAFAGLRAVAASAWAALAANPIGAIVIGLVAIGAALFAFRNDIKLTGDGFTTLGDFSDAYFDQFKGGLQSIKDTFASTFGVIGDTIDRIFGEGALTVAGFLRGIAKAVDFIEGLTQGPLLAFFTFVVGAFGLMFRTISVQAQKFFDGLLGAFEGLGTAISAALSGDFTGAGVAAKQALDSAISGVTINTGQIAAEFRDLGADVGASFEAGFKSTATLDFVNGIIADAEAKAKERAEAAARAGAALNVKTSATQQIPAAIVKVTRELQDQQALLSIIGKSNSERKVEADLIKIKNELITAGAAQASQQINQIDQQIAQLRQKQALDKTNDAGLAKQISVALRAREAVQERTKADQANFAAVLEGIRAILLQNDSLQAQVDLIDGLRARQDTFRRNTEAANAAFARGALTASDYAKALRLIAEAGRSPTDQIIHEVDLQNELLAITGKTNAEREQSVALAQQLQGLAQQGESPSEEKIRELQAANALNASLQRQADLVQGIALTQSKADELLIQKIGELDASYARGAIDLEQYTIGLEQANQATLTLVTQTERDLVQQNNLLKVTGATNAEREQSVALLQALQTLHNQGITPNGAETQRLSDLIGENQALQRQQQILASITPTADKVLEQYKLDLADVEALHARGALSAQQYGQALEDIRLKAAEAGHTLDDGFTRASIKIQDSIRDMASVTEGALTSAFNSAEQALNDFANNGTVDIRALAQSLVADFTKVISHLLILQATEGLGLVKEKAGTGLDAGAAALDPASAALSTGSVTLGASAGILGTSAATLILGADSLGVSAFALQAASFGLLPGAAAITAAAAALAAAAAAMAAAGAAGGVGGAASAFGAGALGGIIPAAVGADAAANQAFLIGERGPELFVPKTAGTIVPHAQTAAALANAAVASSGGGTPVHVAPPEVHVHVENHIDAGAVVEHGLSSRQGQSAFVKTAAKNRTSMKKEGF